MAKFTVSNTNKAKVWMLANVRPHIDRRCNEVNSTSLAEEYACAFNVYENTSDYKIPEWVFEVAGEVADDWNVDS